MKRILFTISIILAFVLANGQVSQHIVRFEIRSQEQLKSLPSFVSVDKVQGNTVIAYLKSDEDFEALKKIYPDLVELPKPGSLLKIKIMAYTVDELTTGWDKYPTYDVYVQYMQQLARDYPDICRLDTIGQTQQGRLLLVLKITDNPDSKEFEPEFFYTSTMHGDEVTGYMFLLRFAGYLLSNYGVDKNVTDLVNNYEIYINPLANPDGTYNGGNSDITGAIRYYANGVDPNRNFFPQPDGSTPSDPEALETTEMKQFASEHNFVMSANLHGGAEVYNFPWDVWTTSQHPHPDDAWFRTVGGRFVDSARIYNSSYFTDPYSTGITEGGDWYAIDGGRQDYMNFVHHCKEVTLEVSSTKLPESSTMPTYFQYLLSPMFWYITESTNGLQGLVLDANGQPVRRRIILDGYDVFADSSFVLSRSSDGVFFRPVNAGTYTVDVQDFSGNTVYSKSVTVSSGRNFVLFAPAGLDSVDVTVKTVNIKDNTALSATDVFIESMTGTYSDTLISDANGILNVRLVPGIYKITTNLEADPFTIVNYAAVYQGVDTIRVQSFKFLTATLIVKDAISGQAIDNATVTITSNGSSSQLLTDASGQVQTELIAGNTYDLTITKTGYYILRTQFKPSADQTTYEFSVYPEVNVSITVLEQSNNAPISGVNIELYDTTNSLAGTYVTDTNGMATFVLPSYDTYLAKILVPGLTPVDLTLTPSGDSINDTVYISRTYARVTLLDGFTNSPLAGATIQAGGYTYTTGTDGIAVIAAANTDTIAISVLASNYYAKTFNVVPAADTSDYTFSLYPYVYYNFTVLDSVTQNPVWAASVVLTVDENTHLSYLTNSSGLVQIFWPDYAPFLVTFSKYGYVTKELVFDPSTEQKVSFDKTVLLVPGTTTDVRQQAGYKVYPNPVSDVLHIDGVSENARITVSDLTGRVLAVFQGRREIDLSALLPGVYLVKIIDNDTQEVVRVIKR